MLDQMKMLGALGNLMKNKDKIAANIKTKVGAIEVVGEAGGGAVKATVSGELKVLSVNISPAAKSRDDLGNLIADAVNHGLNAAQLRVKQAMDDEFKAAGLPNGIGDMGGFGGLLGR
ncbi:MAG: YbaB/EbfC family nucleoid-associated protein [Phycisphaerae bacterium]|jgi:hypothetical protein